MANLSPIQQKIIEILQDKADESSDAFKPAQIDGYGGQLAGNRPVRNLPAAFVDPAQTFEMNAQDSAGEIFDGRYEPQIIIFAQNKASGADKVSDLAKVVDWVINALKGETIDVHGEIVELTRQVRGRLITDIEPASAIITLDLTNFE